MAEGVGEGERGWMEEKDIRQWQREWEREREGGWKCM